MSDTPEIDIAAALALCEKATPGPWVVQNELPPSREDPGWRAVLRFGKRLVCVTKEQLWRGKRVRTQTDLDVEYEANLQFAAAARTGWPAALKALEEAQKEIERLRLELIDARKEAQKAQIMRRTYEY